MADSKVSQLTEVTSVADTDELYIATGGTSKKAPASKVWTYISTKIAGLTAGTAADDDQFIINTAGGLARKLTLSQIATWFLASARTFLGTVTFNKTAETGVAEEIARFKVSDASGYFTIGNAVSTDAGFTTALEAVSASSSGSVLTLYGTATSDVGTAPAIRLDGRVSSTVALANRPVVSVQSANTRISTFWPSGLKIGTDTTVAPRNSSKLELVGANTQLALNTGTSAHGFAGANGTIGTHVTWRQFHDGTNWTVTGGTAASAVVLTGTSITGYISSSLVDGATFTPTQIWQATATGFGVGVTPTSRIQGNGYVMSTGIQPGNPTGVAGMSLDYGAVAGAGRLLAYDWSGAVEKDLYIRGDVVRIQTDATTRVTISDGKINLDNPVQFKAYTFATRPNPTLNTDTVIIITDTFRGRRACISDGANYLFLEDSAIAS